MADHSHIIYIHGSDSNSQSGKALLFAQKFPGILTPDFSGSLEERMAQLRGVLSFKIDWTIIGSSLGGLMGALFTLDHPHQVRKLILLAPALTLEPFVTRFSALATLHTILKPVTVPTVIVHGMQDDVVPLAAVRILAEKAFASLTYFVVQDGHRLHKAFEELDWENILA